jgi:hypothetical protein
VWKYPISDFTQIGLEMWKVLAEIRLLSYVQCKFHGTDFQGTHPWSKHFVKELSREFLYNLVNGLVLGPRSHTDERNGRTEGQTKESGRHIKTFFLLYKHRLEF